MAGEIERIDAAIKATQGKIAAEAREIEAARAQMQVDPFMAQQRLARALSRKGTLERQIGALAYERRCQAPAGSSSGDDASLRRGSTACWLPEGH